MLTIEEAAHRLKVSHKTVRRLINAGQLDAHRVTPGPRGVLRVASESLDRFLTDNVVVIDREADEMERASVL